MWVARQDVPRSVAHPFYTRLNQILEQHDFDGYVEGLCQRCYADDGRPGLPPGRHFRLLPIGYFEGLDAERAIAWRAADSFTLREFLGLALPEAPPDHPTISRTRRLIDVETYEAVSTGCSSAWRMRPGEGQNGRHRRDDAGRECGAAEHRARDTGESYQDVLTKLAQASGIDAHARRRGADRSEAQEEGLERRLDTCARSRREDHEDEGRADASGAQSRACGRSRDGRSWA
jgi:transposase